MPETVPSISAPPELANREAWQADAAQRNSIAGVQPGDNILPPVTLATMAIEHPLGLNESLKYILTWENNRTARRVLRRLINQAEGDETAALEAPGLSRDPIVKPLLKKRPLKQEHSVLQQKYPEFAEKVRTGVQAGIEQEYIPAYVAERVEPALQQTGIEVFDLYLTNASAHYFADSDRVGMQNHMVAQSRSDEPVSNFVHELVGHKLSGGTFELGDQGIERKRTGYVSFLPDKAHPGMLKDKRASLNEVAAIQIELGIMTGDFETIDPDKRPAEERPRAYRGFRKVYATAIERSGGALTTAMITRGNFEDSGPGGTSEDRRTLIVGSRRGLGKASLNRLDKLARLAEEISNTFDESAELIEKYVLPRIHAAEQAEDGSIIKSGWVDVENLPTKDEIFDTHIMKRKQTFAESNKPLWTPPKSAEQPVEGIEGVDYI